MRDLYEVLGVERGADEDAIRKAYKAAARKYHPDVNPGDAAAEEKFKEISAAYEVLSDPKRRKAYDEFGEESLQSGFDPERAAEYVRWKQARGDTGHPFEHEFVDFDLGDLFGFGGGATRGGARRAARGADVHATVELDLATALRGSEVTVQVPEEEPCGACDGAGIDRGRAATCGDCGGSGQSQVARGPMRMVTTCRSCGGRGRTGPTCESCGGRGRTVRERATRVRIPPGAGDGDTLRIRGKGAPGHGAGEAGDLILEVRLKPHPRVRREGLDLYMKLPVTLAEAYEGGAVTVPTFEGEVRLTIPPRSQPGTKLRLRDKGVRRGDKRGDFYVELDVRLPDKPDEQLARALRDASALYDRPVREGLTL